MSTCSSTRLAELGVGILKFKDLTRSFWGNLSACWISEAQPRSSVHNNVGYVDVTM